MRWNTTLPERAVRAAGAAAVAMVLTLAVPGAAWAYVPSGNRTEYKGPNNSHGYQEWTGNTGAVQWLRSVPGSPLASGHCVDSWFDWEVGEEGTGHFDPRVARSCRPGYLRQATFDDGAAKPGMRKAATCYGPNNNTTNPASKCAMASGSTGDFHTTRDDLPNTCARGWVLTANGTATYYSGGTSTDCYS